MHSADCPKAQRTASLRSALFTMSWRSNTARVGVLQRMVRRARLLSRRPHDNRNFYWSRRRACTCAARSGRAARPCVQRWASSLAGIRRGVSPLKSMR